MARFNRMTVLATMIESGLVPVFYHGEVETARRIVDACAAGGARLIEFTNRGEHALKVFSDLTNYTASKHPQLILGVGSIVDAPTAALFVAHGANFIVGPVLNAEVARFCNRRKIAYSPGCGSASEISAAEELGVEIVKIFPGAEVGGPGFVKAVLGPMPGTRIMPTGGVAATQESVTAWLKAGVTCLGMGSNLIRKDWITGENYGEITATVKQVLEWITAARGHQ